MTVTWTGGSGNIEIEVNGPTDNTYTNGAVAVCKVAASAGTFTIPPYVLRALPASTATDSSGFVFSSIASTPFTATGLSAGSANTRSNIQGFGYGWSSGGFILK